MARGLDEYRKNPLTFPDDFTRQDAAILNVQRACQAALDLGFYLIRQYKLGVPQSARDVFSILAQNHWIPLTLAESLKKMIGFRNIAVHDYQTLQLPIVINILEHHIEDFLDYTHIVLKHDNTPLP